MNIKNTTLITIEDEPIYLSPDKALYWPSTNALVIADIHLGKTALFRQHGVPVPSQLLNHDLERLSELIGLFQPQKLIVVGDMFHQDFNTDLQLFTEWRNTFETLQIILVQGNHDRLPMLQYRHMGIDLYRPNLNITPFIFSHKYVEDSVGRFTISGHIHPGVRLAGVARQQVRLPCFRVSATNLVLPAFSAFTGLDTSRCTEDCDYYAVLQDKVLKVN